MCLPGDKCAHNNFIHNNQDNSGIPEPKKKKWVLYPSEKTWTVVIQSKAQHICKYVEGKTLDIKECAPYDSICIKVKIGIILLYSELEWLRMYNWVLK